MATIAKSCLASESSPESRAALERILRCEELGRFEGFSPAAQSAAYVAYYK